MEDFDLLANADEGLRGGLDGTAGDLHMYHYVGEDGLPYRENRTWDSNTETMSVEQTDERVYLWNPSLEKKAANQDDAAREAAQSKEFRAGSNMYYTEEEIKAQWDADEGMGYLKEQTDWDTYWGLVTATTEGVANGTIPADGWAESPEYMALIEESGIPLQFTNDDGDIYNFNGFGYSRDYKFDDSIQGEMIMGIGLGLIGAFAAGPLIAGALQGAGLSASAAGAMSKGIISSATQLMATGEVDLGQALLSAAGSYGMDKVSALEGSLGGILDTVGEATDKFKDLISTGNSIADAAIQAGGMSMLTQLVMNGEVDATQAGIAALMAGGTQAFSEYAQSITDLGGEEPVLEEVVVDAKRKGEDLGNGMTNFDGMVINEAGEFVGHMSDIDLNSDGVLDNDDLQFIETNNGYVEPTYEGNDNVYGDVDLSPPSGTEGGVAYDMSNPEYIRQFDDYSDTQLIDRMGDMGIEVLTDADGNLYVNPEANYGSGVNDNVSAYLDARNQETYITMNRVDHGGGLLEFKDQDYTVGITDDGQEYIIKTDADGNSSVKYIGEEDYNTLADMVDNEDYSSVDAYLDEKGLTSGGSVFDDYNATGSTVGDLNGDGIISSDEIQAGSATDSNTDDWIVLDEGADNTGSQVQFPPKDDTPTDNANDSDAAGEPNDSSEAGQGTGGGETPSTGGAGSEGSKGGSGTPGAGSASGGDGGTDSSAATGNDFGGIPVWSPILGGFVDPSVTNPNTGGPASTGTSGSTGGIGGDGSADNAGENGSNSGNSGTNGSGGEGGGDSTGGGSGSGVGAGSGTGTGETGGGAGGSTGTGAGTGTSTGGGTGSGGGTEGGTGGGTGGNTGGGSGTAPGVGTGTAPGSGGGAGGGGTGGGEGLLSGVSEWTNEWSELFGYDTVDVYQAPKGLEPMTKELRGMLS
jgi:hypothetical protein